MSPAVHGCSLRDTLSTATAHLDAAGVSSPRNDAELLAAFVLGVSRAELRRRIVLRDAGFAASQHDRFTELIAQRAERMPLQHLTGLAPFRHLELAVGPGVFVPGPETELLAGWGIEWLGFVEPGTPARVVDLCAGAGAVALAVAAEVPGVEVYAVEREADALVWLRRNVGDCSAQPGSHIQVVAGDATVPDTLAEFDGTIDLVLANPPYVARNEDVADEGRLFDPPSALWADDEGLSVIAAVVARAAALLRPGGWFGVEHGETHGGQVGALLSSDTWRNSVTHPDLAGRDRFTTAQRW